MPRNKPTIYQLIDNLAFVKELDLMLLEGTSASDVAKFIQDDQKVLTDIKPKALINALAHRKDGLRKAMVDDASDKTKRWFNTEVRDEPEDDEDEEEDTPAGGVVFQFPGGAQIPPSPPAQRMIPSVISRNIHERHIKGGVDELIELEALFRTQVHRIDRLVGLEEAKGGYIEGLNKELKVATDLLMSRVQVKEKFGLIDGDLKFREQLDIKGYSEQTAETLSNPESRHRVVGLIEKLARLETRRSKRAAGGDPDAKG